MHSSEQILLDHEILQQILEEIDTEQTFVLQKDAERFLNREIILPLVKRILMKAQQSSATVVDKAALAEALHLEGISLPVSMKEDM